MVPTCSPRIGKILAAIPATCRRMSACLPEASPRISGASDCSTKARLSKRRNSARVHDKILALPQGYDTRIGEGGHPLSGGQRQLIGLARAIAGSPAFVVLDEPNSNLDGPGEDALMKCIAHLREKRTTLVLISHRPNLVRDLDKTLVLRNGGIATAGGTGRSSSVSVGRWSLNRRRPMADGSNSVLVPGGAIEPGHGAVLTLGRLGTQSKCGLPAWPDHRGSDCVHFADRGIRQLVGDILAGKRGDRAGQGHRRRKPQSGAASRRRPSQSRAGA